MKNKLSTANIILIVIASIILLLFLLGMGTYNSLVGLRESVNNQSSTIDAQLQRRADLIPNLVNTVKGSSLHESEIMNTISESRSKLINSTSMEEKSQADSELSNALSRLLVIVEQYPDLKANAQFSSLMEELSGTENRITVARKDYNDAVKTYNQKIQTFPSVIFAGMFGFSQAEYFQADESSKQVPQVNFS